MHQDMHRYICIKFTKHIFNNRCSDRLKNYVKYASKLERDYFEEEAREEARKKAREKARRKDIDENKRDEIFERLKY